MEDRSIPDDGRFGRAEQPTEPTDIRRTLFLLVAAAVALLLLGGLAVGVLALVRAPETAEALRDAVIVLIGIESLITGIAVLVLIVQVARLTVMIQNEVRPMLDATQETLRTVRGTTEFLSENMVRPVVRMSGAASAIRRAIELIGLGRLR